jgi:FemAB-related protein (PEP-CTERM system-associated)
VGAESPGILEARPHVESLRVEAIELDDPRSDAYLEAHPDATPLHRARWQRVIARTYGYRWRGLLALRGGKVVGALPLFQVPGFPFGTSLISSPFAAYGGVVADDAAAGEALLGAASDLGERVGAHYVELRGGMRFDGLPVKDLYVTFRRRIGPDHKANWDEIRAKRRTSIRQAEKHGLTYRTGGAELLPILYPIYSHSVRNHGTPVFPKSLFRNLCEEFGDSVSILVVDSATKPVAAVLSIFDDWQVLPYYAGTLREAYDYSAPDYMYWKLMCEAADRGCRVFDFGRSKRNTGSFDFKLHWGFSPTPLQYQYRLVRDRVVPDLSPKNPRFSLMVRLWQRMPLAVAERIGPPIVRFFP